MPLHTSLAHPLPNPLNHKTMHKFKTTNIKGKDYVEVNQRLLFFRNDKAYTGWSIESELVDLQPDRCCIRAVIRDAEGRIRATGHAHEDRTSSMINKTSYVENCETSAFGRCLAALGIGIETSIASANEVQMAIAQQANLVDLRVKYGQMLMAKVSDPQERYKLEARESWDAAKYESGIKYLSTL